MFAGLRNALLMLVCLLCGTGQAWAVALGKIDVDSYLNEPFYAEVPIHLNPDEKLSDVTVDLASSSDYQILEVFRDAALNKLSIKLKDDKRGPRAVISSAEVVNTPYFNLVLKLRYGHATNFKKYPVFLDLPKKVQPLPVLAPSAAPSVSAVGQQPSVSAAPAAVSPAQQPANAQPAKGFQPYSGWARIGRYGPMVRGDTISTVAERLRVDKRFTLAQVMIGLYNKNKSKFRENNINLIDAGSYLDVPTAAEVESVPDSEAKRILKEQNKRWDELKKQPIYAAEAEAQKNRYRTRVRVGESASGTPAAPVASAKAKTQAVASEKAAQQEQAGSARQTAQEAKMASQLQDMKKENLQLKQELQASSNAGTSAQQPETADAAAAAARAKRLQLVVVRLQQQIQRVNQQLREMQSQSQNAKFLTYALGGVVILLIAVAGYLLYLLRRVRPHPAELSAAPKAVPEEELSEEPSDEVGEYDIDSALGTLGKLRDEVSAAASDSSLQKEFADNAARNDAQRLEDTVSEPAGIDYLAEAEVYLRYGMEDEALQQINRAIMEKPDHLQAHIKLVELLQTLGDEAAVMAAIESARSKLGDDDMEAFESFVSSTRGKAKDIAGFDTALADISEPGAGEAGEEEAVVDLSSASLPGDGTIDSGISGASDTGDEGEDESLEGLDFILGKDEEADIGQAEEAAEEAMPWDEDKDRTSLGFELPDEDLTADNESETEADTHSGMALSFELPDENTDTEGAESGSAAKDKVSYLTEVEEGALPEEGLKAANESEAETPDDMGEAFEPSDEGTDIQGIEFESAARDESSNPAVSDEEMLPETTFGSESTGELDEILSEFDDLEGDADAKADVDTEVTATDDSTDLSDVADLQETDVSNELDDLLAKWGKGEDEITVDAGPENLEVDRARSLLAEGSVDEAEAALQSALDGERRADALIGLAEVAAMRGDDARKVELLGEAEPLVDSANRDWFDSVKNL